MELRAYTKGITKRAFVAELKAHQKADNFVRGSYWSGEKGCAVGCSLKSIAKIKGLRFNDYGSHAKYEEHLGIPEWLARLEDSLFEGMTVERSKTWPVDFAQAIPTRAKLDAVKPKFMIMLLEHSLASMAAAQYDRTAFPDVAKAMTDVEAAVKEMIRCHQTGADTSAARSAWSAESAASAASAA